MSIDMEGNRNLVVKVILVVTVVVDDVNCSLVHEVIKVILIIFRDDDCQVFEEILLLAENKEGKAINSLDVLLEVMVPVKNVFCWDFIV